MNVIFVAGTDTNVGKTFVAGLVARYLEAKGYKVATQKWIETGVRKSQAVLSFKLAASPHLAAKSEGKIINIAKIKEAFKKAVKKNDFLIIEGTGGLLVPVTGKKLFIDIVHDLKLPVILVAANRLGAINHTLLSLEALKARKMKVLGILFNNISKGEHKTILKDNPRIVKKFAGRIPVRTLPWIDG